MTGFFSKKETESKSRPDGKFYSCASCKLYKGIQTPKMPTYGNFKKKILIIGEAPGMTEDRKGKPWQGKTGQLLERTLDGLGVDLFEDCKSINAVNCLPLSKDKEQRNPTSIEITHCRRRVINEINESQPKMIFLLGNAAVESVIGHRWKKDLGTISKWRGWTIPDQDYMSWICPTFHPSYVERSEREVKTIWRQDLKQALSKLDESPPVSQKAKIEIIDDLSVLENVSGICAVDYETTGIKPHAKGHRIICAAVADSVDHCYAFMMPSKKKDRMAFLNLMWDKTVGKVAQNMKYEDHWTNVRLRQPVRNWEWDTMIATHILDNRQGITSLKFQTYVQFGVVDYDSEIAPYLQAKDSKNSNAINRIYELLKQPQGKEKLLEYCGWDAIYELRLAFLQMKQLNYEFLPF